ncbi:MAG: flippase-like domain-containing protein [Bacteroidetes bacterium]|nr:flippase-like domain-containing protein [Bacteroidota bacterium]
MEGQWPSLRRWAGWACRFLLAGALLYFLVSTVQRDIIAALFLQAQPAFLFLALGLLPLNLLLQYKKWQLLVHGPFPQIAVPELRASLLLGFTFGIVTPARVGEFGGRAAGMRSVDGWTLVGLTAVDKFAGMVVTVVVGCVGLMVFCWRHPFIDPLLLTVLFSVFAVIAVLLLLRRRSGSSPVLRRHVNGAGRFQRRIASFRAALQHVRGPRLHRLLWCSILFYLTFLLQFFLLLSAFGPVDLLSALAGISTIFLIKTIIPPITLGELGIREGASVYVLGHAGILAAAAFNAALLLFVINILLPSLAGLVVLLWRPRQGLPDGVSGDVR